MSNQNIFYNYRVNKSKFEKGDKKLRFGRPKR